MTPNRTRIKFCGITRIEDALTAASYGVDAIGFVFAAGSPRRIDVERAAAIRAALPPLVSAVALVRNAGAEEVGAIVHRLRPDLLQFHGEEPAAYCGSFGLPYLKSVAMRGLSRSLADVAADYPDAAALLLDGHAAGEPGGQGETFDWQRAQACGKPLILAGGLGDANVGHAIVQARPYAVDVSSGIESGPGIKDSGKMAAFIQAVQNADRR